MKATIRSESMRISGRGAGNSVALNRSNSCSELGNSSHNDSEKVKIVLVVFVLLEILDAALTFFGISQRGLIFEKNLFARNFIASFGFLPVAAIKIGVSAAFAVLINYLCGRFEKYGKILLCLSVLLALIAFYGAGSSAYVLLFYP